ncbi:MAG: hypothetical protein ABFC81_06235, partial [Rectinema sp.]
SWEEDKARKAQLRKLRKREEEILARLDAISAQKSAGEREMGLPENYSDGAKMKRLLQGVTDLEEEAAELNEEWLGLAELLSAET